MRLIIFFGFSAVIAFKILCTSDIVKFANLMKQINKSGISIKLGQENVQSLRIKRNTNDTDSEQQPTTIAPHDGTTDTTNVTSQTDDEKEKLELLETFKRQWPLQRWREYGLFTDDYVNLINEHWLRFPPPSPAVQRAIGSVYLLFSTIGCWGNLTVLFMYFR